MWPFISIEKRYEKLRIELKSYLRYFPDCDDLRKLADCLEEIPLFLTHLQTYGAETISIAKRLEHAEMRLREFHAHFKGFNAYLIEQQDVSLGSEATSIDEQLSSLIVLVHTIHAYVLEKKIDKSMFHSIDTQFNQRLRQLFEALHAVSKKIRAEVKQTIPSRRVLDHFKGTYQFHAAGDFAAYNKLRAKRHSDRLSKQELKAVDKLLSRFPRGARISELGLWFELGSRVDPVRILIDRQHPERVFYIFTLAEHHAFAKQLSKKPNEFIPARN